MHPIHQDQRNELNCCVVLFVPATLMLPLAFCEPSGVIWNVTCLHRNFFVEHFTPRALLMLLDCKTFPLVHAIRRSIATRNGKTEHRNTILIWGKNLIKFGHYSTIQPPQRTTLNLHVNLHYAEITYVTERNHETLSPRSSNENMIGSKSQKSSNHEWMNRIHNKC